MDRPFALGRVVRLVAGTMIFGACCQVVGALARQSHAAARTVEGARPNVSREIPSPTSVKRAPSTCPNVLLLGSSQSSAVTASTPGGERSEDQIGTTIDALAERWGDPNVCFHRIAVPGFLPGEMLVMAAYEVERGTRPRVAIAPIIWESLAHDDYFRPAARDLFADTAFAESFLAKLKASGAAGEIVDEYVRGVDAVHRQKIQVEAATPGERIDAAFTSVVAPRVGVLGNVDAQVTLRRGTFENALSLLTHGGTTNVHEVVPVRLERNVRKLVALADYLRAENVTLIAYRVPERTDVAPLTSRIGQESVMERIRHELEQRGATVLDLHDVVPNALWGWAGQSPDRTHFAIRGHELVAGALIRDGKQRGAFRSLEAVP